MEGNRSGGDGSRGPLAEASSLLRQGRNREAADAFGRLLLEAPGDADALEGAERSAAALAEERRLLDAMIAEAASALDAGDRTAARSLLEDVVRRGGDRDRALALLDRTEDAKGRLALGAPMPPSVSPGSGGRSARRPWSRRALAGGFSLVLVGLGAGVGLSWERLVGDLVRTPSPASWSVPSTLSAVRPSPADRAVAEAERLMRVGDPAAALKALEGIPPDEPSYPFARQLRGQARAALKDQGRSR